MGKNLFAKINVALLLFIASLGVAYSATQITLPAPGATTCTPSPKCFTYDAVVPVDGVSGTPYSTSNPLPVSSAPPVLASAPTNCESTAPENSHNCKASSGILFRAFGYNSGVSTIYIMLFNTATGVPVNGTSPSTQPIVVPGTSNFSLDYGVYGRGFSTGIVAACSSTPTTLTLCTTAPIWFSLANN